MAREKLPLPPSGITGELGNWLNQVWRAVNQMPTMSYFSGTNPNTSGITGAPGDWLVNIGSASTDTRSWQMAGASLSTNSWRPIRIA